MLMKILSHIGQGNHKSVNEGNLTFSWILKTFHLSSERLLQFGTRCWGISADKQRGSLQSHVSLSPPNNVFESLSSLNYLSVRKGSHRIQDVNGCETAWGGETALLWRCWEADT